MRKPLDKRCLVVKETGEKIPFSSVGSRQMRSIMEAWEKGEKITIQGSMSDAKWFSGTAARQLKLAADFVSGEENEDGDVFYGTAKKSPSVVINDLNASVTLALDEGRGPVVMKL